MIYRNLRFQIIDALFKKFAYNTFKANKKRKKKYEARWARHDNFILENSLKVSKKSICQN